jgi:two-component system, OmpR family, sensor histidine kinase KdpD
MSVRDVTSAAAHGDLDIAKATGTLRVYLGVAAGAGSTCAMLDEGHRLIKAGTDVVAACVDCHGRTRTEEQAAGIESIPPKVVRYRGCLLEEMDLDAVLSRCPAVVLIDELAHRNVPGSGRHDKRWQDVQELLVAGIDVITTVNVQHLDSVAGAIERLSGRAVSERVPDWVVRRAARVELVDCSPGRLRSRILRGEVYAGLDIPRALAGFFLPANLAGLRELARRFLAGDTEQELLEVLRKHETASSAEGGDRFMLAVTPEPGMVAVLRRTWRLAARCGADLYVVHIRTSDTEPLPEHDTLVPLRRLTIDLGAIWIEIADYDAADALVRFARQRRITHLVLASGRARRGGKWRGPGGPVVQRVLGQASPAGIDVHVMTMADTSWSEELDGETAIR